MMRKLVLFTFLFFSLISLAASSLNDAKALYLDGNFDKALPIFMQHYKRTPRNASLNHWIGVCLYNKGSYKESLKYLKFAKDKKITDSPYYLALSYFELGDNEAAMQNISDYEEFLSSNKKNMPDSYKKQIENIRLRNVMLEHVEKVEIIDSIVVDKNAFFQYFRISPEIGKLKSTNSLDVITTNEPLSPVYVPESADKMLWADISDNGHYKLYQTTKLLDNSWDNPSELNINMPDSVDIITPFVLPDGTTYYFASNGPESLGGYDIFVASKDLETGEFYSPQNLGMPYNSSYDDYMYAIDEFTGAGWWATDRNCIPGKVTIYIFKPSTSRVNYSVDDPNLKNLARISSIRDTWQDEADNKRLLNEIAAIDMNANPIHFDFTFNITNGKIYHRYSEFKSIEASNLMRSYVKLKGNLETKLDDLKLLREAYYTESNGEQYSQEIIELEHEIDKLRSDLKQLKSDIRRAELSK